MASEPHQKRAREVQGADEPPMATASAGEDGGFPVDETGRYIVDFSMHKEQRSRLCAAMAGALGADGSGGAAAGSAIAFLEGGRSEERSNTDAELLFRQESFFFYLTGVKEPDCAFVLDLRTERATLFIPRPTESWIIVMGDTGTPASWAAAYGLDEVRYLDELDAAVAAAAEVHVLEGKNTDSGCTFARPQRAFPGAATVTGEFLYNALTLLRSVKTGAEVRLLQWLNDLSSDAHLACMRHARPGLREYQYESIFQHFTYFRGGARTCAYTPIAATGPNCAVLHYGHAGAPNDRRCARGDLALFDMGAEFHCYASDITNTFPVDGAFTDDQRTVFEAVAAAQRAVMEQMRPGCDWKAMHALSYEVILTHLRAAGLLRGDLRGMMDANVGAVFMPHGLGHLMGLETHDVGGFADNDDGARDGRLGFRSLRMVQALREGMVITVEPGCYFIDYLLDRAMADEATKDFFVAEELQRFRGSGGVRLEDNVLITADGARSMTSCPRTVEEVEKVMRGEITDRRQLTRVLQRAV